MQDYNETIKKNIANLNEFSQTSRSTINQQSLMSSYITTKDYHLLVIGTAESEAQTLQERYDRIQSVIDDFKLEVRRTYPRKHLHIHHRHYSSKSTKKALKAAYTYFKVAKESLKELHNVESEFLTKNGIGVNERNLDENTREQLNQIRRKIEDAEEEYTIQKDSYHIVVDRNYEKLRIAESERFQLTQNYLRLFIEAAHPSKDADKLRSLYDERLTALPTKYNALADIKEWASDHGVSLSAESIPDMSKLHLKPNGDNISIRKRASRNDVTTEAATRVNGAESESTTDNDSTEDLNNSKSPSVSRRNSVMD